MKEGRPAVRSHSELCENKAASGGRPTKIGSVDVVEYKVYKLRKNRHRDDGISNHCEYEI